MGEESINLQDYVDALLSKWWLLLLGPLLAGTFALGLVLHSSSPDPQQPVYEATTAVLLEGAEPLAQFPALVLTRAVLERAAADPELPLSVAQLRNRVSALKVPDAPLLQIKATDSDPALAVAIADGVAQSLVEHVSAFQRKRNAGLLDKVATQLDSMEPAEQFEAIGPMPDALAPLAMRPYVVYPAEASETPINEPASLGDSRPIARNIVVGVILGGFTAVMIVFGLEYIQAPIRSPEKLERTHLLYRLGILPRWMKTGDSSRALSESAGREPVTEEAFREAATSVALRAEAQPAKVLAVISPDTGDGRSSVVANLGVTLASSWKDVILVDADLRRPSLHYYFGLGNGIGLSNFLRDAQVDVADIIQDTAYPGLKVITSGPVYPGLEVFLTSPRMDYLWERLEQAAQLVLVDTPPVRATTDSLIISSQAQGVVLLVNSESCRQEQMKGVLAKLAMTSTLYWVISGTG